MGSPTMASAWSKDTPQPVSANQYLTICQDERKMATFAQYAMASAQEALTDAEWMPTEREDLEATVRQRTRSLQPETNSQQGVYIGSGIGSLDDAYDTTIAFRDGVCVYPGIYSVISETDQQSRATEKFRLSLFQGCSSTSPADTSR